jgi:hypothetical protein
MAARSLAMPATLLQPRHCATDGRRADREDSMARHHQRGVGWARVPPHDRPVERPGVRPPEISGSNGG